MRGYKGAMPPMDTTKALITGMRNVNRKIGRKYKNKIVRLQSVVAWRIDR